MCSSNARLAAATGRTSSARNARILPSRERVKRARTPNINASNATAARTNGINQTGMDLFFRQPAIVIDYGLDLLLAELLPVGVHVCSPAVLDDIHHLGGAHFGHRLSNILYFELPAFRRFTRAVRAVTNRAFVEINILGILLRPGAPSA